VEDYDRFRYGHASVGAENFANFSRGAARVRSAAFTP
jgi:hypothetical protein